MRENTPAGYNVCANRVSILMPKPSANFAFRIHGYSHGTMQESLVAMISEGPRNQVAQFSGECVWLVTYRTAIATKDLTPERGNPTTWILLQHKGR